MRTASVFVHDKPAGLLTEEIPNGEYAFAYSSGYEGPPVSLALPVRAKPYRFNRFPPFFDGLLPEGWQFEALLKRAKLDRSDRMGQLLAVGADTVGAVTVLPPLLETAGTTP